jgi:DNA topoisomerase III
MVLFEHVKDSDTAKVVKVEKKQVTKCKPVPLNTANALQLISRQLQIAPDQAVMNLDKLYSRGFISYPRTNSTRYSSAINLKKIVELFQANPVFGEFATKVCSGAMWSAPRNGNHEDETLPPIHPVRNATREQLTELEWRVFELLARHFLACISKDAVGTQTTVTVLIADE